MTEQLERELRRLFAEDAEHAPISERLAVDAQRRVRDRRRTQSLWAIGATAAAVTAIAGVSAGLSGGSPGTDQVLPTPRTTPSTSGPTGPLPDGGMVSCVERYSPSAVTGRAFAFDGTVASIAAGAIDGNNASSAGMDLVAVTFAVHEWYAGGSEASVTVDITPPLSATMVQDAPPAYDVGSRLLVSGEPLFGGAPLKDAVAWGCGFTRYYDEATARTWRSAFQ